MPTIGDSIIKIERLEKEYMTKLKEYEQLYNSYLNELKNPSNTREFVQMSGYSYFKRKAGSGPNGEILSRSSPDTANQCQSMCASDLKCGGANFYPANARSNQNICTIVGDGGELMPFNWMGNVAIVTKSRQQLILLQSLNARLIQINNKIKKEIDNVYPISQADILLKNKKQAELIKYYSALVDEQTNLENTLRDYETIEEQYNNNFVNTVSQSANLRLWTAVTLIVLVITLKHLLGITGETYVISFVFILFILFIFLSLNLTMPQGFALWGVFVLIILFTKFK